TGITFEEERDAIMLKKLWRMVSMLMLAGLMTNSAAVAVESVQAFRQQNGLLAYAPPAWFLEGYFVAREKNPGFVFGPVQDFVTTLGGTPTWLIEDLELKGLEQASAEGKKSEYSLFLEIVSPESTEYWVFVVLPHASAQDWFDARRAFHGRKAEAYYGKTQKELERALNKGLKITAELRFLIEQGETSLQVPEDVIMGRYNVRPVFDLSTGHRLHPAAKTE
ncbi:MAG: hypothetical protein JSW26_18270, partial [Desulfobacterales bacterium]